MNLIGQWNKDKTQCWKIAIAEPPPGSHDKRSYCAECWSYDRTNPDLFTLTHTMPWRDTLEEAQRDIPNENT